MSLVSLCKVSHAIFHQGYKDKQGRNEAAYRLTCHFIGKKEDWESIILKIEGWNRRNNTPLSRKELDGILKSAKKMYDQNQEEQKESPVDEISLADLKKLQTDLNNRKLPDLTKLLPADHYLNLVTTWMTGLSDTYYEYQVCAGLWSLSALLQGKGALPLRAYPKSPAALNVMHAHAKCIMAM